MYATPSNTTSEVSVVTAATTNSTINSDALHVVMVLDASGSMESIADNIIEAVNTFINKQKEIKEDDMVFTLVSFNSNVRTPVKKIKISDMFVITSKHYKPDGGTALYDAIGETIVNYKDDKKVCMVIVTDGEENSSSYYNLEEVKSMIEAKKEEGWKFIYLSSDLSVAKQGNNISLNSAAYGQKNVSSNNIYSAELSSAIVEECYTAVEYIRKTGEMYGMGSD